AGAGQPFTSTALSGTPDADGTTQNTFQITGATPNALLTVTSTLGTLTTADAGSTYTGIQVLADSTGAASFTITAPYSTAGVTSTITMVETAGAKCGVFDQTYAGVTPTSPASPPSSLVQRFDFNGSSATTAAGFTGVPGSTTFNMTTGYGWKSAVYTYDY